MWRENRKRKRGKEKERKKGKPANAVQDSFFNSSLFACSNHWCFKNWLLLLGRDKVTVLKLVGIGGRCTVCSVCSKISGASSMQPWLKSAPGSKAGEQAALQAFAACFSNQLLLGNYHGPAGCSATVAAASRGQGAEPASLTYSQLFVQGSGFSLLQGRLGPSLHSGLLLTLVLSFSGSRKRREARGYFLFFFFF